MHRLTENASLANGSWHDGHAGSLWKALVRRRALFLGVFSVFFASVAVFTMLQSRTYATVVKVIVGDFEAVEPTPETFAELSRQRSIARQVASEIHLTTTPAALLERIRVDTVPKTKILAITAIWTDPATSARVANAFATVFEQRMRKLVMRRADGARKALALELPGAQARLLAAESALSAYREKTNIIDVAAQTTNVIASQAALDAKAQQAELDARQLDASLAIVRTELARTPRTIVGEKNSIANPVAPQLQSHVATLRGRLAAARAEYTDDYPVVKALEIQLATEQGSLRALPARIPGDTRTVPSPLYQQLSERVAHLQSARAGSQARLATIAIARRDARESLLRLPEEARRLDVLQREVDAARDNHDLLRRKYQEVNLSRAMAIGDVAIVEPADAQSAVTMPNVGLNVLLGLIGGLAFAFATVVLAEFFDDRFRTEDDVRTRLGLPVLALVPTSYAPHAKPPSIEAFYRLITALRYCTTTPPRSIAFTSPEPGDGKSTVAVNMARVMGLMRARVLVVDADLRRPTIHAKLGIANDRGLTDVLVGLARFGDVIQATEHEGVSAITSGRSAPNPVALLQSDAFDRFLKSAKERFDYVVIDGPALRSNVDGAILGMKTDGTVLVVSARKAEVRAAKSALATLRGIGTIDVLGVVFNAVRRDARDRSDFSLGGKQSIALSATHGD